MPIKWWCHTEAILSLTNFQKYWGKCICYKLQVWKLLWNFTKSPLMVLKKCTSLWKLDLQRENCYISHTKKSKWKWSKLNDWEWPESHISWQLSSFSSKSIWSLIVNMPEFLYMIVRFSALYSRRSRMTIKKFTVK